MPPWLMSFLQMAMQNQNQQPAYDRLYGLPDAVQQSQMLLAMSGPPGAPRQDLTGLDPVTQEMLRGTLGQPLPPGLPLAVQNQIRNQPSYGEGEVMAPQQWWNPALGGQLQMSGPQREERLAFDRREASGISDPYNLDPWTDPWAGARPEGSMWSSRPPGASPFASPPSQGWHGFPLGLY